jgi:sugar phosphate isomerase/epimerase
VVLDTYHLWWDPELYAGIARAGAGNRILAHHISDFLVPTRDLLNDRGMMGDGVIDFKAFRRAVKAAGYHGPQEVEIFSTMDWWTRSGDEVLSTCIDRFNTVC